MVKILVIIDAINDKPCKVLNGLTPLEAAETPNLDYFASKSNGGTFYSINEKTIPRSQDALISLLGYDLQKYQFAKGPLEAFGEGMDFKKGDLAFSTSFATVENENIIDKRVGRSLSSKEAEELTEYLIRNLKLGVQFDFKHLIGHKGILVFKGNYSENITSVDPSYKKIGKFGVHTLSEKEKLNEARALDPSSNSKLSAKLVNEFVKQSHELLKNHPINIKRNKKYLLPANVVIPREAGISLISLPKRANWGAIVSSPMEKGILKLSGAQILEINYPEMKDSNVYENLFDGVKEIINFSIKELKQKSYQKYIIHFKELAVASKDNKPLEKKKIIELIDKKFFGFLKDIENDIEFVVTGNYSITSELRTYSADLIPFIHFGKNKINSISRFTENEALKGSYSNLYAKDVLKAIKFL